MNYRVFSFSKVVHTKKEFTFSCHPEPCPVLRYGIDSGSRGGEKVSGFQPPLEWQNEKTLK
jgi:hypothetical protein